MCERRVIDLTDMSDGERVAFLAGCAEEVCVSYRFPVRPALAAAALAAALPTAAAAQQVPAAPVAEVPAPEAAAQGAAAQEAMPEEIWVEVGGIKDPANAEFVENPADASLPTIPVVYEDAQPAAPATQPAAAPGGAARR
jgi:hypothetical protein